MFKRRKRPFPFQISKRIWWYCNSCGALLNNQNNFTAVNGKWICTACKRENTVIEDSISKN